MHITSIKLMIYRVNSMPFGNNGFGNSHSFVRYFVENIGAILGGVFGGIIGVLILLGCACLAVKWAINKRRRNAHVVEAIDEEDPDVQLLNHDLRFSSPASSTYNQSECPPNTSEEEISVRATLQPLPLEVPPPTPNSDNRSQQLTLTLVRKKCSPVNYSSTYDEDIPFPPQSLPLWQETLSLNSNYEDPWPPEDQPLTLVRRRSSPVSHPLASSSSVEDEAIPPISFPRPIEEEPLAHLLSPRNC